MKKKILISIIVLALFSLMESVISFMYSPIAGAVGAQQMRDTMDSYAMNKFVSGGYMSTICTWVYILVLTFIWYPSKIKNNDK